jgi:hypothetical protein
MPVTTTIGLPNLSRGAAMFSPPTLEHDPEKQRPVFPKDHAQTKR